MRYGIIVNPVAGGTDVDEKREILEQVREVLGGDCSIDGLDSNSADDFRDLAAEKAGQVEILIAAGGDGSVSDAINAVEEETILSFLPLGSACALRDALDLPEDPVKVAERIRDGREHRLDLILCDDDRKAFVCGLGVEGGVLKRREELQDDGKQGFIAYASALASVFGEMDRTDITLSLDGRTLEFPNVATAIVTKIPYYGYKMKVIPEAVFDDGFLHLRVLDESWPEILGGLAKARLVGSETETPRRARHIEIKTQKKGSCTSTATSPARETPSASRSSPAPCACGTEPRRRRSARESWNTGTMGTRNASSQHSSIPLLHLFPVTWGRYAVGAPASVKREPALSCKGSTRGTVRGRIGCPRRLVKSV